jgi:hypothetical protein
MRQERWTQEVNREKSFWHAWDLNAWCSCDMSFLYLFDSNPSSHSNRGADWRVKSEICLARSDLVYRLGQIWSIVSVRFGLSMIKSPWVNSQLLASPLLALLYLRLVYLTQVWMHLLGSIHTLMRQSSWYVPYIKGRGKRAGCCRPCSPSLRRRWWSARGSQTMGTYLSVGEYSTDYDSSEEEDNPEY